MRTFTLGTLVTRCLRRANKQGDGSFQAPSGDVNLYVKTAISEVYAETYATVAEAGRRHFEKEATITTDGTDGSATWGVQQSDMMTVIGVDRVIDTTTGRRRELFPIEAQERELWMGSTGTARAYCYVDQLLQLYPKPLSGQTYKVLYIPQPADLSAAADNTPVEVVCPAGEKHLIWGVAVLLHGEGETDAQLAIMERDKAKEDLLEWAQMRLFLEPPRQVVRFDELRTDPNWWDEAGWWNR